MRARNIKPGYFKNEDLAKVDPLGRILWAGLWCLADREGLLEYRPERIKVEVLPYDSCNVEKLLEGLCTLRLIEIWCVKNGSGHYVRRVIEVPKFRKHQNPHKNEKASEIRPLLNDLENTGALKKLLEDSGTNPADS